MTTKGTNIMRHTETTISSATRDARPGRLDAPTTIPADELEAVAGGTAASLKPGLIGPTSGMIAPEV
jgi:hypothetical protein